MEAISTNLEKTEDAVRDGSYVLPTSVLMTMAGEIPFLREVLTVSAKKKQAASEGSLFLWYTEFN